MALVLASRNAHKLRELSVLLAPHELVALPGDIELPPETGRTFAANALGKARAAAAGTGLAAVADDSGIAAAALGGEPGIRSARYAGEEATDEENLHKLLDDVPADGDTRVAYVCALALVRADGTEEVVHGRCEGRLSHELRGHGGFGYDPAFVPGDEDHGFAGAAAADGFGAGRTMAELSVEEKDAISHRGRAARALLDLLGSQTS